MPTKLFGEAATTDFTEQKRSGYSDASYYYYSYLDASYHLVREYGVSRVSSHIQSIELQKKLGESIQRMLVPEKNQITGVLQVLN